MCTYTNPSFAQVCQICEQGVRDHVEPNPEEDIVKPVIKPSYTTLTCRNPTCHTRDPSSDYFCEQCLSQNFSSFTTDPVVVTDKDQRKPSAFSLRVYDPDPEPIKVDSRRWDQTEWDCDDSNKPDPYSVRERKKQWTSRSG